jgi:hypothetical protein
MLHHVRGALDQHVAIALDPGTLGVRRRAVARRARQKGAKLLACSGSQAVGQ